jgi:hypothetical protein
MAHMVSSKVINDDAEKVLTKKEKRYQVAGEGEGY